MELNHDLNVLVFHQQLPIINKSYHQAPFEMRDGVPFIHITIDNGKTRATNWFMFHNGYSNCLLVDKDFAKANLLYGIMTSVGSRENALNGITATALVPKLRMGDYAIANVPIEIQNPLHANPYDRVIAGNDLLKRFNVIIDYQESILYFKPNAMMDEPYDKGGMWLQRMLWAAGLLLLLVFFFLKRRFWPVKG